MLPAAMFGMFQSAWNMTHKETEVTKTLKELRQEVKELSSFHEFPHEGDCNCVYCVSKNSSIVAIGETVERVLALIDTKLTHLN